MGPTLPLKALSGGMLWLKSETTLSRHLPREACPRKSLSETRCFLCWFSWRSWDMRQSLLRGWTGTSSSASLRSSTQTLTSRKIGQLH
eukprot:gene16739-19883_t